jgi:Glycosyl hydrolase family 26
MPYRYQKLILIIAIASGLLLSPIATHAQTSGGNPNPSSPEVSNHKLYLPITAERTREAYPIMLGVYPYNWWAPNPDGVISNEFIPLDRWTGKRTSLAGVYHNLLDTNRYINITYLLGRLWDQGYTPFINLYANVSAYAIASGSLDDTILAWATAYAEYARQGNRTAFLAPLYEMNGNWYPYSGNPANFISAYRRIVNLFVQAGVPSEAMLWVFAPNGWSKSGMPGFEEYYPGDAYVDAVGLSSYNYGYLPDNYPRWSTAQEIYGPYLDRIRVMAPNKPIIIAQTGTTAETASGYNVSAKNTWLYDAYQYLANQVNLIGIVYYNANVPDKGMVSDWLFYQNNQVEYFTGYRDGAMNDAYQYIAPQDILHTYFPDH